MFFSIKVFLASQLLLQLVEAWRIWLKTSVEFFLVWQQAIPKALPGRYPRRKLSADTRPLHSWCVVISKEHCHQGLRNPWPAMLLPIVAFLAQVLLLESLLIREPWRHFFSLWLSTFPLLALLLTLFHPHGSIKLQEYFVQGSLKNKTSQVHAGPSVLQWCGSTVHVEK